MLNNSSIISQGESKEKVQLTSNPQATCPIEYAVDYHSQLSSSPAFSMTELEEIFTLANDCQLGTRASL